MKAQNVCRYNNVGYCKNKELCRFYHRKEDCSNKDRNTDFEIKIMFLKTELDNIQRENKLFSSRIMDLENRMSKIKKSHPISEK